MAELDGATFDRWLERITTNIEVITRVALDERGVTFPDPVELLIENNEETVRLGPASVPDRFQFNRPFLFFLYDHPTESILLIGRVAHPVPAPEDD